MKIIKTLMVAVIFLVTACAPLGRMPVFAYVSSSIQSAPEPLPEDYWQSPAETLLAGKGDCEDKAFLLWWLWKQRGIESNVVFGVFDGVGHAWVELTEGGHVYLFDPSFGVVLMDDATLALMYRRRTGSFALAIKYLAYEERTGIRGACADYFRYIRRR